MTKYHPCCLKLKKSREASSNYVEGVFRIVAPHVPKDRVVTILSRPPPYKIIVILILCMHIHSLYLIITVLLNRFYNRFCFFNLF